ncbi:metallophosphoesterase family protein [Caldimonas brevitalea]|uniref:Phosphoesterase n=1 Tax=Caldimonas brevitalea TaxID=413882 RepID=A0A0G3BBP3_9BURK|nr:metallophosphoesterase family protein [Caldimonas brevitalea]AKJ26732.1 phosphoesterase [Caldimonas brevitalea]
MTGDRSSFDVGVISDTHGLLRPQALAALAGCRHILHGGDIGGPDILERLADIAPVSAVRGNNDRGAWAERLPEQLRLELGGVVFFMLHDLAQLPPLPDGVQVLVSGHSHKPRLQQRDGVWWLNPGSAGPRRFTLPISVARVSVGAAGPEPRLIELALPATATARR